MRKGRIDNWYIGEGTAQHLIATFPVGFFSSLNGLPNIYSI